MRNGVHPRALPLRRRMDHSGLSHCLQGYPPPRRIESNLEAEAAQRELVERERQAPSAGLSQPIRADRCGQPRLCAGKDLPRGPSVSNQER